MKIFAVRCLALGNSTQTSRGLMFYASLHRIQNATGIAKAMMCDLAEQNVQRSEVRTTPVHAQIRCSSEQDAHLTLWC